MTLLQYTPNTGYNEADAASATHEVPDAEWATYKLLQNKACDLEDRWLVECGLVDEFADLRGVLSDEEIEAIRTVRSGTPVSVHPPGSVVSAAPVQRPPNAVPITPEQASNARALSQRKCEHRRQLPADENGRVFCGQCGGLIYGGTGVRASTHSNNLKPYLAPVSPSEFEGNV